MPDADIAGLFGADDEGPIGATALILGHRDTDFAHVRTQQVGPMPGTLLPKAQRVAERFLSRGDILGGNLA